jgi:phospholipid transport system substrate-binding protein
MSSSGADVRRRTFRMAGALALCAALAVAAEGPREVVRRLADQVLAVLKDKSLASDVKRRRIEDIVYADVDFDVLSRLVLARNWTRFAPEQQQRFEDEFKQHLSATYGKSIDSYKNEELQITGDREEARGDWTVKSKIVRGGGSDDVVVDYRLRQVNGEWKIIDFIVEGVSLVANFRSQFQDILSSKTPAELIALIHDKNVKGEEFEGTAPKPKR